MGQLFLTVLYILYMRTMYILKTDDRPTYILENFERPYHVILYVDDILLIAPTITQLEKLLHDCENELQWLDMVINFKKSSCLRVGPRFNASCAKIVSLYGQALSWAKEIKYLRIYMVSSTLTKCDLSHAKSCFYRGANEIFGKIGRFASVNVILELLQSKCIPALLYGLVALPLNKTQLNSLDFVINRFFNETVLHQWYSHHTNMPGYVWFWFVQSPVGEMKKEFYFSV